MPPTPSAFWIADVAKSRRECVVENEFGSRELSRSHFAFQLLHENSSRIKLRCDTYEEERKARSAVDFRDARLFVESQCECHFCVGG